MSGRPAAGEGGLPDGGRPDTGSEGVSINDALAAAGQVGRDLLAVEWEATPLGPPDTWPAALQTVVRIILSSRFSMWMAWGPELTFFCNDAYRRDTLGKKYPWALGRSAREVWAEIWPDIGPRIEAVLRTGEATWDESLLLFLERSGFAEETYHTFSYSPLTDDAGATAGMLCVVSEDTDRVIGEQRIATLRDLGSETTAGRDEREYLAAACRRLAANNRPIPFALVYLFDEEGAGVELAGSAGISRRHPAAAPRIELADPHPTWPVAEAASGEEAVVERLEARFPELPAGAWPRPPSTAVVLPLLQVGRGERAYGCLIAGVNRYRPLDGAYLAFLRLLAAQLASGIAGARAYEAERRRAEDLAELDRAKTAFFTNVSHELRTPLTLMLGPAEDALADANAGADAGYGPAAADPAADSDAGRQRLEMIVRNGQRLLRLVNTLLDFSRLEAGRTSAVFAPVELGEYTAELASMFQSAVQRAGLEFVIDCRPLEEPVYVDREMWARIVLNLLSNALKFTFSGSISVRLEHDGAQARLSVSDTGIGIDPEEQPRLFERFRRVHGARARTYEGSGIGLALVAELAALHGGRAEVQSAPGEGSTFSVAIPFGDVHLPADQVTQTSPEVSIDREVAGFLAEASRWTLEQPAPAAAAAAQAAAQPDPAQDQGAAGVRSSQPDRPRILVVDDNADMRDYVASVLAAHYEVRTAPDGQAALELARADPPDLVLSDVMMPRLDGFGLLAALHEDPRTLHIPVVMLSARAGEEGVIEGLEAGADDYLVKPFSARELRARVNANLELDRVRRTRDELARSHQLQSQAERLAEVGSFEVNLADGSMTASEQLRRMLSLTDGGPEAPNYEEALLGALRPEDRAGARAALEEAIATGGPFGFEVRLGERDRWVRVAGDVVSGGDGGPGRLRGYVQDVTQRRRAERAQAIAAAAREAAAREHQIADALQRRLLPNLGVDHLGLEIAAHYQPGVRATRVGGDWYDAIDLGAGRTALVIGDVAGRGVRAASLMGQVRVAALAYARLDLSPTEILELLDATVREISEGQLVTCIYGVYDPAAGEFRYANAGHLPPLLALPGRPTRRLDEAPSPPLGLGSTRFTEQLISLPGDAILALYTDGLVERRDDSLDARINALTARLEAATGSAAAICESLVEALVPGGGEDDVAILVARATGEADGLPAAELDLLPTAAAPSEGRRFTTSTLCLWSLPDAVVQDAELIASELVTNAVVHGRPPIRLRLRRMPQEVAIEVDDASSALPRKLAATPLDLHGRGLAITDRLAARWAARTNGSGKTIWSTIRIRDEGRPEAVDRTSSAV